jgi:hypothetical protein
LDEYFITQKNSYHINKIFYPRGQNILVYMENIWPTWQEYFLKILCCSQKFCSCAYCSLLKSSSFMFTCSHNVALLRKSWLRDAKVAHDWGNNIIIIQVNGTIRIVVVTKHLGINVKQPKVLLCYDY